MTKSFKLESRLESKLAGLIGADFFSLKHSFSCSHG